MARRTYLAAGLLFCASVVHASTNLPAVRMEVTDGSTLIGVPLQSNIMVRTSFADVTLPLDRLASLTFTGTNGAVAVRLRNGDMLSGVCELRQFEIDALVGRLSVPAGLLKTVTVLAQRANLPPELVDSLVLYYSFDSDEGDRVTDHSTKENHGRLKGKPTFTPNGKVGGAIILDGKDDYIDAGNTPSLKLQNDFTLAAWVWFDSVDSSVGIITKSAGHPDQNRRAVEMQTGGANVTGYFWSQDGSFFSGSTTPGTLTRSRWHHITVQHDSRLPDHQMRCYVDGVEQQLTFSYETTKSIPMVREVAEPVRIGCFGPGRFPLKGQVDEVMIFSRVLTIDDIKRIYGLQSGI